MLAEAKTSKPDNGADSSINLSGRKHRGIPLLQILSEHFGLAFWPKLPMESIDIDFTGDVSIQYLKKHKVVPLITDQDCVIAINDPSDFQPVDDLRQILKFPI
jgi:general secretion pathway protein E